MIGRRDRRYAGCIHDRDVNDAHAGGGDRGDLCRRIDGEAGRGDRAEQHGRGAGEVEAGDRDRGASGERP